MLSGIHNYGLLYMCLDTVHVHVHTQNVHVVVDVHVHAYIHVRHIHNLRCVSCWLLMYTYKALVGPAFSNPLML